MNDTEKKDTEKKQDVPFYIHEAVCEKIERTGKEALESLKQTSSDAMQKMDRSNKRILVALLLVCVTLLFIVYGFLNTYKVMTTSWVGFIDSHFNDKIEDEEGVDDGLLIQDDSTDDSSSLEE